MENVYLFKFFPVDVCIGMLNYKRSFHGVPRLRICLRLSSPPKSPDVTKINFPPVFSSQSRESRIKETTATVWPKSFFISGVICLNNSTMFDASSELENN